MNTTEYCNKLINLFVIEAKDDNLVKAIIVNIVLNVVLAILATLGNALLIITILRSQTLKTPSYLLITSLAFTDLLVGLLTHPLYISILTLLYINKDLKQKCLFVSSIAFTNICISGVSLAMSLLISIDRCLALVLRHRYRVFVTKKRVVILIVLTWVLVCLSGITTAISINLTIMMGVLGLAILLITCVFYMTSFRLLYRYTSQIQPNSAPSNFNVAKYRNTLTTMVIILGCLVVCYAPHLVTTILLLSMNGIHSDTLIILHYFSVTIVAINSCLNPVIYVIRFSDIRHACRQTSSDLIGALENVFNQ